MSDRDDELGIDHPLQAEAVARGQAPCGLLNEKSAVRLGFEVPQLRQANCSLKTQNRRLPASAGRASARPRLAPPVDERDLDRPPPIPTASIDSARRFRMPSFITRRSTTIEMSCL